MPTSVSVGEPVCLVDGHDLCGEGAVWEPAEQAIYWSDINGFKVYRLRLENAEVRKWVFDEPVTALALTTEPGILLLIMASGVHFWNPDMDWRQATGFRLPEWPKARCNDARVDPYGALWIATMQNNVGADGIPTPISENLGKLIRFEASGRIATWREDLGIGNTIAWSPDNRFLFSGDTLANRISRFRIFPDGTLSDETSWCEDPGPGLPDGSAMDVEGYLWNCRHGGGCLLRIDPRGKVDREVTLPVQNPTTCIFGGDEMTTLFLTSAAIDDSSHRQAGGLFALQTSVRGLGPNRFVCTLPSAQSAVIR